MNTRFRILWTSVGVLAVVLLSLAVLSVVGAHRFRSLYAAEKAELFRAGIAAPVFLPDPARVRKLPEPVRRYLEILSVKREAAGRMLVLHQSGVLRSAPDAAWTPFTAEQAYSVIPPGFVWLARARMAPGIDLWARDKYVDGRGHMLVTLLGLVTLADATGPDLDRGAALRFLGEIVAFPPGIVAPDVGWRTIDPRHAGLFIRRGDELWDGIAEFDGRGLLSAFHARRPMDRGGRSEEHAWSGTFSDWREIDGLFFPGHWEATWHLPDGDFTSVKIDIRRIATE